LGLFSFNNMEPITRAEAKAKGLKQYFTGKPCKRGHTAKRYTSIGACITCQASCGAAYQKANAEAIAAWNAAYRKANAETIATKIAAYYRANAETIAAKNVAYRKANAETIAAYHRAHDKKRAAKKAAYYRANAETIAAYAAAYSRANPHIINAKKAKYRAAKLNATPAWADLEAIKKVYDDCAFITQATGVKHHVDHIVPLQGETVCGLHTEANLQIITASENCSKNNKLLHM
jgi:hypothetical protein